MVDNSCDGEDGVGEVTLLLGEEETVFGGEGVIGRARHCRVWAIGGFRAGSEEAETLSSSDREARTDSRSVE